MIEKSSDKSSERTPDVAVSDIDKEEDKEKDNNIYVPYKEIITYLNEKTGKKLRWDVKSKKISTTGLEVEFDDGPYYESVGCEMRIEESERPVWSSVHRAVIVFENDHDEELNIEIPISKWDFEKEHTLDNLGCVNIQSLRYLGEFDILWVYSSVGRAIGF